MNVARYGEFSSKNYFWYFTSLQKQKQLSNPLAVGKSENHLASVIEKTFHWWLACKEWHVRTVTLFLLDKFAAPTY
jgi:hypothetical protein